MHDDWRPEDMVRIYEILEFIDNRLRLYSLRIIDISVIVSPHDGPIRSSQSSLFLIEVQLDA